MVDNLPLSSTNVGPESVRALEHFVADVLKEFQTDISSIILYGSGARADFREGKSDLNLLVVFSSLDMARMSRFIPLHDKYLRNRIVPLALTKKDLVDTAHVFPLKFLSFKEANVVLSGIDVLKEIDVDNSHVRFRCKQELQNLLMRLRYHYISNQGRGLTNMMSRTSTNFIESLRVVILLETGNKPDRVGIVEAASSIGIDGGALKKVLDIKGRDVALPNTESRVIFERYLRIVEQLLAKVDNLKE
ncbi:MAG: nucleotidyltransferase domain-containing protein [Methanobacteriota archaeon]